MGKKCYNRSWKWGKLETDILLCQPGKTSLPGCFSIFFLTSDWCTGLDFNWMPFNTGTVCVCLCVSRVIIITVWHLWVPRLGGLTEQQSVSHPCVCVLCVCGARFHLHSHCHIAIERERERKSPYRHHSSTQCHFSLFSPPYHLGQPNKHLWC